MTPYRGIIRISCRAKKACPKKFNKDVQPSCVECPDACVEVLDLDGRVIFAHTPACTAAKISRSKKGKP